MPDRWRRKRGWAGLVIAAAAVALTGLTPGVTGSHGLPVATEVSSVARDASLSLTVMSYNVEGLPVPARFGRSAALDDIGRGLAELRRQGRQPDVVLLQEAFAASAARIAGVAGYRYAAEGPTADQVNRQAAPAGATAFVDQASHWSGENDGKWLGSGLRILSDYPIARVQRLAFPAWACAGYDCLANKGAVIAWIDVPGAPEPVAFIDTHLNSRAASGVDKVRADIAYKYQVLALSEFIGNKVPVGAAAFLGGDFNSGQAAVRKADLGTGPLQKGRNSLLDALADRSAVAMAEGPDAKAILARGKDWLFYRGSQQFPIVLSGFEVPFGRAPDGTSLSDHLGYEVRYRLARRQA